MANQPQSDPRRERLHHYLTEHGLKATRQRDAILDVFLGSRDHLTAEQVYIMVRQHFPRIGYATVYRTLKLLADCGLAYARNFGDGATRFEPIHQDGEHHDHMICVRCKKIIEFENDKIEHLQNVVAAEHKFRIMWHKMEFYGLCEDCQKAEA
jgi:Fur family transcriptional regulator, ferric uptake regulator